MKIPECLSCGLGERSLIFEMGTGFRFRRRPDRAAGRRPCKGKTFRGVAERVADPAHEKTATSWLLNPGPFPPGLARKGWPPFGCASPPESSFPLNILGILSI